MGRLPKASKERLYKKLHSFRNKEGKIPLKFTYSFPLSKSRKLARDAIEKKQNDPKTALKLLKHHDFVEKLAGLALIEQIPVNEKVRSELITQVTQLKKDKNPEVVYASKQAHEVLKTGKIKRDEKRSPFNPAAHKAPQLFEDISIAQLKRMLYRSDTSANALSEITKRASKHINSKNKEGLSEKNEAIEILKDAERSDNYLGTQVSNALSGIHAHKERLTTRTPLFATSKTKELAHTLKELDKISKQLQKEYGSDFIGVQIHGSIPKGYYLGTGKSDLDYRVISNKPEVKDRFDQLAEPLGLCEHTLEQFKTKKRHIKPENASADLFYGIFVGDKKKLREHQKRFLTNTTHKDWENVRREIMRWELYNLEKADSRINPQTALKDTGLLIAINRTPPPLDQMRKHFKITKTGFITKDK